MTGPPSGPLAIVGGRVIPVAGPPFEDGVVLVAQADKVVLVALVAALLMLFFYTIMEPMETL